MAAELPEQEAGVDAELPELGLVALCIAVGCAEVLRPLLGFLQGVPARGPVLDAAAAAAVLAVPMAYLAGVMLLYLHVAPAAGAAPAPVPPASLCRFAVLVCSFLLFAAFVFFLAAGGR